MNTSCCIYIFSQKLVWNLTSSQSFHIFSSGKWCHHEHIYFVLLWMSWVCAEHAIMPQLWFPIALWSGTSFPSTLQRVILCVWRLLSNLLAEDQLPCVCSCYIMDSHVGVCLRTRDWMKLWLNEGLCWAVSSLYHVCTCGLLVHWGSWKGLNTHGFVYTENVPYFVLCLIKTVDKQGQIKAVHVWLSIFAWKSQPNHYMFSRFNSLSVILCKEQSI